MSTTFLLIWLGVVIVISILDYLVPGYFTKLTGGSRYGSWGAIAGLFIGMIYPPVGMILGSLLGAFVAEFLFAGKDTGASPCPCAPLRHGFLLYGPAVGAFFRQNVALADLSARQRLILGPNRAGSGPFVLLWD